MTIRVLNLKDRIVIIPLNKASAVLFAHTNPIQKKTSSSLTILPKV